MYQLVIWSNISTQYSLDVINEAVQLYLKKTKKIWAHFSRASGLCFDLVFAMDISSHSSVMIA